VGGNQAGQPGWCALTSAFNREDFDMFSSQTLAGTLLACACAVGLASAANAKAPSADEKAVLASVQAAFDGLAKRDKAAILKQMLPGGNATLMRNGKPVQMSFEALADRLSQPGTETREERIHDPLVRVDNDVAIVWAPFEFLIDGKVDHCGRDIVQLVRVDGHWLIAALGDNNRTDCAGKK
jgi:Putative lumazine-binding